MAAEKKLAEVAKVLLTSESIDPNIKNILYDLINKILKQIYLIMLPIQSF